MVRIVHVLNFQFNKSGQSFGNCDHKIHQGLIRCGHYVYPFPVNDISRQMAPLSSKRFGKRAANRSLLETCGKVKPEVLLLGHGQLIDLETLDQIKRNLPHLKIAQWYVDPLEKPEKLAFMHERLPLLDALFCTTGGPALAQFQKESCLTAYLPNPVDHDIENLKAFEHDEHRYDLVFIGTDRKDATRAALLEELAAALSDFRFGVFGSLGQPGVYGSEKDDVLYHSRASLNLTRHEPQPLYTSDRIAQLMGNGILACVHEDFRLQDLYGADSLLTFRDPQDLAAKLKEAFQHESWRQTARRGWEVSHQQFGAQQVAAAMLDFILKGPNSTYPWPHDSTVTQSTKQ